MAHCMGAWPHMPNSLRENKHPASPMHGNTILGQVWSNHIWPKKAIAWVPGILISQHVKLSFWFQSTLNHNAAQGKDVVLEIQSVRGNE